MHLKLSESPKEWRKFAVGLTVMLCLVGAVLAWRGAPAWASWTALFLAGVIAGIAWVRPAWIRPVYRASLKLTFPIGQAIGKFLLGVVFVTVLMPLAWLGRLVGKQFLELQRESNRPTYWQPVRSRTDLKRQF